MENFFQKAVHFLKEAYSELKKVTWLSKKEVIASTIVVSLLVAFVAIFVGIADFILSKILGTIL
ncbi:MAG: preprotein translocase subunit SecE [Elusimicrobiota bacterium]